MMDNSGLVKRMYLKILIIPKKLMNMSLLKISLKELGLFIIK